MKTAKQTTVLTAVQFNLLELIRINRPENGVFEYSEIKKACDFRSFDGSFNALLFKGHIKHFTTTANKNTFITTVK
jgi:hypothetical protein